MPAPVLITRRLKLRPWREEDLVPFRALNSDSHVMRYLPKKLTDDESDLMAARLRKLMEEHAFGFWAVEVADSADFIGFTGLHRPDFESRFMPCMEIGWRLAYNHWGKGYASEAASAALSYAFGTLGQEEVVAFTVPENQRSRNVMERIGMTCSPADEFDHPNLPEGHTLRRHVLYRINHSVWRLHPGSS